MYVKLSGGLERVVRFQVVENGFGAESCYRCCRGAVPDRALHDARDFRTERCETSGCIDAMGSLITYGESGRESGLGVARNPRAQETWFKVRTRILQFILVMGPPSER